MTGLELLTRARELAYHHEKESGQHGTASMLFDLINEIERLREAAKGSAVIVNQAVADKRRLRAALDDALGEIVELVEADIGREVRGKDLPALWHRGNAVLKATAP